MKNFIIISLLFVSTICNAKFLEGTIIFKDGHSEMGFIKSFLEQKIINLSLTNSLEHDLNLDDKSLKFKIDENSEIKIIKIDDIDEVHFLSENGASIIYKVIFLKEISRKGEILDEGRKVFLPLIRKGKINIYGIKFTETASDYQSQFTTRGTRFYYQNEKENYAINYYNFDNEAILLSVQKRVIAPLKILFKDCPEIIKLLDTNNDKTFNKNSRKEYMELQKEFKKLPNNQKEDLKYIHIYQYNFAEKLLNKYENCN